MRTFILTIALIGSCFAAPQLYDQKVDYEIPSGKVSYSSKVGSEGLYGQYYEGVQPAFRYGQTGVKPLYASSQPVVKSVVAEPLKEVQTYGVQTFQEKYYGGYVQPAVRYNEPTKVVKPVVPFVAPVTPVLKKYVAEARISQPVTPVVQHVSPVVQHVSPVFHQDYPVFQHVAPVAYPKTYVTPYVQPYEKVVKPVAKYVTPFVQPYTKYAPVARIGTVAPVVPTVKYTQGVAPVVQPVVKYGHIAPFYQHNVAVKSVAAPAAILSQNQDSSVDGTFQSTFQTENGIQSAVSGVVKPVYGSDEPAQVMSGSYSYTAPDGTPVITTWYADENGFHADGDHIPVVPEEIQKSLEYIHSLPVAHEEIKYVK